MTDARRHRLCLLLALLGTMLMGAMFLDNIWQKQVSFEMPVFKASKPPLPEWAPRPTGGPAA